jgi:hypothetical protein
VAKKLAQGNDRKPMWDKTDLPKGTFGITPSRIARSTSGAPGGRIDPPSEYGGPFRVLFGHPNLSGVISPRLGTGDGEILTAIRQERGEAA